jgi:anthranilate synthase/aminodeoxychorismate synthase-like glutamine amidotransferase
MTQPLRVVFVDNFDSFTWNLVDEFARRGAAVEVWRNDAPAALVLERALAHRPALLVLSPGPGRPAESGCCMELIRLAEGRVPLFGVCLGHQAMVEAFGGTVGSAREVVHGKTTRIEHGGGVPFDGVPSPFVAGRYHSLAATRLPERLVATATGDRTIMAVAHRDAPMLGVQFHPESILTPDGGRIIDNVVEWAGRAR